jgi:hypothetical protein
MKSEPDYNGCGQPLTGRAKHAVEQVGGNAPSSDSEIRCVSHEAARGSQSGAYRLTTIRATGRTVSPYRSGIKQRIPPNSQ